MAIELYAYWQYGLGALVVGSITATWRLWEHPLRRLMMLLVMISLIACITVTLKRIKVGPLERTVGETAENFGFDLVPGSYPRQLYNFKGTVMVLTFFNSTCDACRFELLNHNKLAKTHADKNLRVLTLTTEPASYLEGFVKRNPFATTSGYLTKERSYPAYVEIAGERPVTIVIDKNFVVRRVLLDGIGYKKLEETVLPYL